MDDKDKQFFDLVKENTARGPFEFRYGSYQMTPAERLGVERLAQRLGYSCRWRFEKDQDVATFARLESWTG